MIEPLFSPSEDSSLFSFSLLSSSWTPQKSKSKFCVSCWFSWGSSTVSSLCSSETSSIWDWSLITSVVCDCVSVLGISKFISIMPAFSHSVFSVSFSSTVPLFPSATAFTTSSKLKSDNEELSKGISASCSTISSHWVSGICWSSGATAGWTPQKSKLKSSVVGFEIFSNFSKLSNTSCEPQKIGFFSSWTGEVIWFEEFATVFGFMSAIANLYMIKHYRFIIFRKKCKANFYKLF